MLQRRAVSVPADTGQTRISQRARAVLDPRLHSLKTAPLPSNAALPIHLQSRPLFLAQQISRPSLLIVFGRNDLEIHVLTSGMLPTDLTHFDVNVVITVITYHISHEFHDLSSLPQGRKSPVKSVVDAASPSIEQIH